MPYPAETVTTTGAFLLVLALVVPVVGVLLAFVAGGRHAERVALATLPLGLAIAVAIAVMLRRAGGPLVYLSAHGLRRSGSRCARTACRWSCWRSRPS